MCAQTDIDLCWWETLNVLQESVSSFHENLKINRSEISLAKKKLWCNQVSVAMEIDLTDLISTNYECLIVFRVEARWLYFQFIKCFEDSLMTV